MQQYDPVSHELLHAKAGKRLLACYGFRYQYGRAVVLPQHLAYLKYHPAQLGNVFDVNAYRGNGVYDYPRGSYLLYVILYYLYYVLKLVRVVLQKFHLVGFFQSVHVPSERLGRAFYPGDLLLKTDVNAVLFVGCRAYEAKAENRLAGAARAAQEHEVLFRSSTGYKIVKPRDSRSYPLYQNVHLWPRKASLDCVCRAANIWTLPPCCSRSSLPSISEAPCAWICPEARNL